MSKTTHAVGWAGMLSTALLLASAAANAQSVPPRPVPTNLPGVTANPGPPMGFNPLTASDQDLARYGIPPRPNAEKSSNALAAGEKAVSVPQDRIVPILEQTEIRNAPPKLT